MSAYRLAAAQASVVPTISSAAANRYAETVRRQINEVFEEERVPWAAYGMFSNFHIFTNPGRSAIVPTHFDPLDQPAEVLFDKSQANLVHKFRLATMTGGVDFSGSPGGVISATHGEAELEHTIKAVRNSVRMLKQEGEV